MKKFRIVAILLVMCLASSCFVGSTFAKYVSTARKSDTATIAQWSILVNNDNQFAVAQPSIDFPLFATTNIEDTYTNDGTLTVRNSNKKVKADRIAPGTSGSFSYTIENLSEVDALCSVDFSIVKPATLALQFSRDGQTNWDTDINKLDDVTELAMETGSVTVNIYWRWVYENNADIDDTALGISARDASEEVTITVELTVTQVD